MRGDQYQMLDQRKGRILQAIVDDYVETAEPVGSEWLANRYDFGCRSATLRYEMAGMLEQGYLLQPHTSAGRIPSDLGYRYYVDRLMQPESPWVVADAPAVVPETGSVGDIGELVQATCRHLAGVTECLGVATPPSVQSTQLRRLFVTEASTRHVLLVMLLSNGQVVHRILEAAAVPPERVLGQVAGCLNRALAGREVTEVARGVALECPPDLERRGDLLTWLMAGVMETAAQLADDGVFVEGAGFILRQREFQDVPRLERLLTVLTQRQVLADLVRHLEPAAGVRVLIGEETPFGSLQGCAVVATRYAVRDRTGGIIGVVGPTRMRYARAVAAVEMMARTLSEVLARASLG